VERHSELSTFVKEIVPTRTRALPSRWVFAINAIRPLAYPRATFSRLEINLANREKRYENIGKAKPAVAAWLGSMHPALHAA
jgi:hypothetical protein